jgi:hypothetical protein
MNFVWCERRHSRKQDITFCRDAYRPGHPFSGKRALAAYAVVPAVKPFGSRHRRREFCFQVTFCFFIEATVGWRSFCVTTD